MRALIFGLIAPSILAGGPVYGQQLFDYRAVDAPCAASAPTFCPDGIALQTAVNGINAAGDIVGTYVDGANHQHGFVAKNGRYTTLDVPSDFGGGSGMLPTVANGINPAGDIVGTYTVPFNDAAPPDSPLYCPTAHPARCRSASFRTATSTAAFTISTPACRCTAPSGITTAAWRA
jgi:hypothetical protein